MNAADDSGAQPPELPPVFVVLDIGTTIDVDGDPWPTAVIDASDHPEVADLARVHAVEGIGDISTRAGVVAADDDTATLLLVVDVRSPVRCSFAMAFTLPAQTAVLLDAAEHGHLMIATTPPESLDDEQPVWLAIDIDGERLRSALPA